MEPKLARLWSVYDTARADYLAVSMQEDDETVKAAKFLRDTAENTIQYLQNRNVDPIMMTELEATYNMAKAKVVALSGGKKRKFDEVEMDRVTGTPRGPSHFGRGRGQRRGGAQYQYPPPPQGSDVQVGYSKEPSRRSDYLKGLGISLNPVRGRGGHSGTPYGYSRQVDSYHPYGDSRYDGYGVQ